MTIGLVGHTTHDTITDLDGQTTDRPGGSPLYARRALRAVGLEPVVVTKGGMLEDAIVLPSRRTVHSVLVHLPGRLQQRLEAVGEPFTPAEATHRILPAVRSCRWLVLGGQSAADFPPETIATLAGAGHLLALDGQGLARGFGPGPVTLRGVEPSAIRGVQVLKLNRLEWEASGAAGALVRLGVPELLVSDGPRGAFVLTPEGSFESPGSGLRFPDPTGAGDALTALYALARSRDEQPAGAVRSATGEVERMYRHSAPGRSNPDLA